VSVICPQCQSEASDHAAFCPQCGTTLSSRPNGSVESSTPPQRATALPATEYRNPPTMGATSTKLQYSYDVTRLSQADRITGVASAVLLISLFLPWFGVAGFTIDGLATHGYLYIDLLLAAALLVYLGARAGWDKLQLNNSLAHAPLVLVASVVNLLLVLLAFLFKPAGTGWQFGAFLAVIAAFVAAAPIGVPAVRSRRSTRR